MNAETQVVLPRAAAFVAATALLFIGAGAMFLLLEMREPSRIDSGSGRDAVAVAPTQAAAPAPSPSATMAPVAPVASSEATSGLRLPGVVAPNAYRQVVVTPLVSGRLTAVSVQLGDRVRKGQVIAQVYSPELAEARTRYVSAVAMLEAHDRELNRTRKLVEIGASSRQELERIHALHTAQTAVVESARAQLELFGVAAPSHETGGAQSSSATTSIPAPMDGVVTERSANVGLNVDPAIKLFTVVDLSTIWVLADVHERDIGRVRVGTKAHVTSDAFPGRQLDGHVSYIDPQLDAVTRTTKARIELRNPSGELRLGMYVDVMVDAASVGGSALTAVHTARISVTPQGYQPASITVKGGRPIKLTFTRTSDNVCGTEVRFPSMSLKRALPLNQPVDIEFTPSTSGDITFVCDMNMLKGTVIVQ